MSERLLVTPAEAAERLAISRSTVYELLQRGMLPSVKLGNCRRIPAVALVELVDRLSGDGEP